MDAVVAAEWNSSCALFHAPAHTPVAVMTSQAAPCSLQGVIIHSQWCNRHNLSELPRIVEEDTGMQTLTTSIRRATAAFVITPLCVKCTVSMQFNATLATDTSRIENFSSSNKGEDFKSASRPYFLRDRTK